MQINVIVICLAFIYWLTARLPFPTQHLRKATWQRGEKAADEIALLSRAHRMHGLQKWLCAPVPNLRHRFGQRAVEGNPERSSPCLEKRLCRVFEENISAGSIHARRTFGKTWIIAFRFEAARALSFAYPPGKPRMRLPPVRSQRLLWLRTHLFVHFLAFHLVVPMVALQVSSASVLFRQRPSEGPGREAVVLFESAHLPPLEFQLLNSLSLKNDRAVAPHSPFERPSRFIHRSDRKTAEVLPEELEHRSQEEVFLHPSDKDVPPRLAKPICKALRASLSSLPLPALSHLHTGSQEMTKRAQPWKPTAVVLRQSHFAFFQPKDFYFFQKNAKMLHSRATEKSRRSVLKNRDTQLRVMHIMFFS